jgi:hypothetical protein
MYAGSTICNSSWFCPVADDLIVVHACGWGEKYDTGMIIVFEASGKVHTFDTPTETGAVHIIGAK